MTNISETGSCVLHEQWVYATHATGPGRKMMNESVLIKDKRDGKEEISAGNVLLLFHCAPGGLKSAKKWHLYGL